MDLRDLLSLDAVIPALKVEDKKQALQALAEIAAKVSGLKPRDVYMALGNTAP